jgi:putative aminopeptidase FrvX
MERRELLQLAERALRLPTAPYHEQHVKDFVIRFCRALRGVRVEEDGAGNVIAKCGEARTHNAAPLVFVAHMDHPGFEVLGGRRAEFLGGVPKEMFKGARVRFYAGKGKRSASDGATADRNVCLGTVRAVVGSVDAKAWPGRKLVRIWTARRAVPTGDTGLRRGDIGMWDVPAFRVTAGRLHAAAIDDVLGTVVALATLAEVSRRRSCAHVWCAFTRAEEVGFHGAMRLICSKKIPRSALVVSIEMSRERPWARVGNGPVVRVGDRATVFDPAASAFLWDVAQRCRERQPGFQAQRCLMDGGSCEATAFAGYGDRAGGLCLPLGNYHNIGRNRRPRAEYVSVRDLEQLVRLTTAAAEQWPDFGKTSAALRRRMSGILRSAPRPLRGI